MTDLSAISIDSTSGVPLYRQLADSIRALAERGVLQRGDRLPATRELALQLGLNRTTVSAAYSMLEQSGILQGHVGRGSFIAKGAEAKPQSASSLDWEALLPPLEFSSATPSNIEINLASSRPATASFPLTAFRKLAKEVIDSPEPEQILQLGSPHGYMPLRRYLIERALQEGVARASDDLLMTNGCQQALDLIGRMFFRDRGSSEGGIVLESPVYHGLLRIFNRTDATIHPVPIDEDGINTEALEVTFERVRPKLLVVTPSFQNPMGTTLSMDRRRRVIDIARRYGVVLIENDIYSELRYRGKSLPTLKELDRTGNVVLLRSYSKISFPGLRVGWVIAPRPFIARMAESKQVCDLHSDQLAQAVLLRFAESGELAKHLEQTRAAGVKRLDAVLSACERYLPAGSSFTRPDGGMCLWVDLPSPLNAENVLARTEKRGVTYLPGSLFSNRPAHRRGLRLSFGALTPEQITRGIRLIGEAASEELRLLNAKLSSEPVPAVV